jgi:acyl-CoA reductase-like NAD-dependent aldehyde dehydrogenase
MGGKNAVIVMADADLDKAATAIHGGAFGSTGQRCTATSRVIAHPDVKQALLERLVEGAKKIKIGPGLDETIDRDRWWTTSNGRRCELHRDWPARRRQWCRRQRPERLIRAASSNRRSSTTSTGMRIFQEEIFGRCYR